MASTATATARSWGMMQVGVSVVQCKGRVWKHGGSIVLPIPVSGPSRAARRWLTNTQNTNHCLGGCICRRESAKGVKRAASQNQGATLPWHASYVYHMFVLRSTGVPAINFFFEFIF